MVTPNEQYISLAKAIGCDNLYFKREDLHPLGSHKGRSIPTMIDHYLADGAKRFAVSSSGNAALAAALYIKDKPGIELEVFVGENISPNKLSKLETVANPQNINKATLGKITTTKTPRPIQALTKAIQQGVVSLRQSTDDLALTGYASLAEEILDIKDVGAIFIGTSSGTTAQALAQYFLKNKNPIQVHIVQTSSCHPMLVSTDSSPLDSTSNNVQEVSIADAIVDKTAFRKTTLIPLIKETSGAIWCASNKNILEAQKLTKSETGLDISTNSALSVVGAIKAIQEKYNVKGSLVCVICGE